MSQVNRFDSSGGRRTAFFAGLGRALGTRARRRLLAITLSIGMLAAVGMTLDLVATERAIANVVTPVQLLMSVAVPFFGVLVAADLRRGAEFRLAPTLLPALALAVGVAIFGFLVGVVALALPPRRTRDGGATSGRSRWVVCWSRVSLNSWAPGSAG